MEKGTDFSADKKCSHEHQTVCSLDPILSYSNGGRPNSGPARDPARHIEKNTSLEKYIHKLLQYHRTVHVNKI